MTGVPVPTQRRDFQAATRSPNSCVCPALCYRHASAGPSANFPIILPGRLRRRPQSTDGGREAQVEVVCQSSSHCSCRSPTSTSPSAFLRERFSPGLSFTQPCASGERTPQPPTLPVGLLSPSRSHIGCPLAPPGSSHKVHGPWLGSLLVITLSRYTKVGGFLSC